MRSIIQLTQSSALRSLVTGLVVAMLLSVTMFFAKAAQAQSFEEGVHYTEFDLPRTDKPTITEIYSVFCPGCYAFEANYRMIKKAVPENVEFERHHSWGMVGTNAEAMNGIAKLNAISEIYSDELSNRVMWDVFTMIHEKRTKPDVPDLHKILGQYNNLVSKDLHKVYDSFQVRSMIAKSKQQLDKWRSEGVTKGTPTWVVNGKYRINIGKLDRDQFFQEINALLNYLLEK